MMNAQAKAVAVRRFHIRLRKLPAMLAVLCTVATTAPARDDINLAMDTPVPPHDEPLQVPAIEPDGIQVYAGADFVTKYIARGIVFSNEPSLQPWLEAHIPLRGRERQSDSPLYWRLGTWNSVQAADAGEGIPRGTTRERLRHWYEADLYTGLTFDLFDNVSAMVTYFYYTSPSGAFDDIHEMELRLAYDDSSWWDDALVGFSLNPAIRFTQELHNQAVAERWYLQPSLTPSYTFHNLDVDLTIHVPLIAGFGGTGWYQDGDGEDLTFGFFQTGARLRAPLDFPFAWAETITFTGGVDVIIVADPAINGFDNEVDIVGRIGLSLDF